MRIKNCYSEWCEVTSGISQGSVLGPLLLIIYINDLPDVCAELAEILLFADEAKISKTLHSINDKLLQQSALNKAVDWSKLWLLSLNIIKCIVLNIRRQDTTINTYHINTPSGNLNLQCVNSTKDLGIIVDNSHLWNI